MWILLSKLFEIQSANAIVETAKKCDVAKHPSSEFCESNGDHCQSDTGGKKFCECACCLSVGAWNDKRHLYVLPVARQPPPHTACPVPTGEVGRHVNAPQNAAKREKVSSPAWKWPVENPHSRQLRSLWRLVFVSRIRWAAKAIEINSYTTPVQIMALALTLIATFADYSLCHSTNSAMRCHSLVFGAKFRIAA